MKLSKTAFLTFCYPNAVKYIDSFMKSIQLQTIKEFELIIINDGVLDILEILSRYSIDFPLYVIDVKEKSISDIRIKGIIEVLRMNFDYIIFGDIDDTFSKNRVEVLNYLLKKHRVIVNDICIFNNNVLPSEKNYFLKRLYLDKNINLKYIVDKNIFGLSNTAINTQVLKEIDITPKFDTIAYDWFLYSKILTKTQAFYTSFTSTNYRQYDENTVGINKEITDLSIETGIKVKQQHYNNLASQSELYNKLSNDYNILFGLFHTNVEFKEILTNKLKNKLIINPLWWEIF